MTEYPGVEITTRSLTDADRQVTHRSIEEAIAVAEAGPVAAITFGSNLTFRPARLEVELPAIVEITNESARSISIDFDWDGLSQLLLEPGQVAEINLPDDAPDSVAYNTILGNAKVGGAIVIPGPDLDESQAWDASDLTGAMRVEVPEEGAWRAVAGYRSLTVTRREPLLPLGSTSWLLRTGDAPVEETLRIDGSDRHDQETAAIFVASFSAPKNCDASVDTSSDVESVRRFTCGSRELAVGYRMIGDAAVYFTMVQDGGSRLLEQSLESLAVDEAGTFNDLDDIHPSFFTGRVGAGTVDGDLPEFIDISAGSFGSPLTIVAFDVFTSPAVELRNFTAEEVVVTANARPFVQVPPLSAVLFSVDDFGTSRVGLSLGDSPLTRLDLPFDLSWRSPLEAIEMTSELKAPDLVAVSELLLSNPTRGDFASEEFYPVGWARSDDGRTATRVEFERRLDDLDPATFRREVHFGYIEPLVRSYSGRLRSEPTSRETTPGSGFVQWEISGRPTVTLLFRGRDGELIVVFVLESSPEDHEILLDGLLIPAYTGFSSALVDDDFAARDP